MFFPTAIQGPKPSYKNQSHLWLIEMLKKRQNESGKSPSLAFLLLSPAPLLFFCLFKKESIKSILLAILIQEILALRVDWKEPERRRSQEVEECHTIKKKKKKSSLGHIGISFCVNVTYRIFKTSLQTFHFITSKYFPFPQTFTLMLWNSSNSCKCYSFLGNVAQGFPVLHEVKLKLLSRPIFITASFQGGHRCPLRRRSTIVDAPILLFIHKLFFETCESQCVDVLVTKAWVLSALFIKVRF